MTPSVQNMKTNKGTIIPNQFEIFADGKKVFQSHQSVIAVIETIDGKRKVTLDQDKWNYSRTTSKYRNLFLGETTKETETKINSGEYTLSILN